MIKFLTVVLFHILELFRVRCCCPIPQVFIFMNSGFWFQQIYSENFLNSTLRTIPEKVMDGLIFFHFFIFFVILFGQ